MMDAETKENAPPAEYAKLLEHIAGVARENVQEGQNIIGTAFLLKDAMITDIVASTFGDENVKDGFAEMVRQRASKTQPDAIALLSEAWTLPPEWSTKEKYAELRKTYKEIADAPFKVDIVMLHLETRAGDWLGRAEMQKTEPGRSFGAFDWLKTDSSGGRFMHLLPVLYATPQQVTAFLALARRKFAQAGLDPDLRFHSGSTLLQVVEKNVRQAPADRLDEELIDGLIAGAQKFGMCE